MRPGRCVTPSIAGQASAAPYGIRRIGRGEREGAQRRRVGEPGELAQPVDGGGCRELRRPELLDHVAAAAVPGLLEAGEHAVRLGEAARQALGLHRPARDDAVAVEQQTRGRGRAQGRLGLGGRRAATSVRRSRAAAAGCSTRATEAPRYIRARGALRAVRCACEPPPSSIRTGANVSFVTRPAQVRLQSASHDGLTSFSALRELAQLRGEVRAAVRERLDDALLERARAISSSGGSRVSGAASAGCSAIQPSRPGSAP